MPTDNLLTVAETADLVGVSVGAVYKRIDAEKKPLPTTRRFGLILIARHDAIAWKREREAAARAVLSK
jgi:hypothetical protein